MRTNIGDLKGEALLKNNENVQFFRATLNNIMRQKGWAREASNQSALIHITFWQCGAVPKRGNPLCLTTRRVEVTGWHGTGTRGTCRWFGDTKTFFAMYDSGVKGYKPVVESAESILNSDGLPLPMLVEAQVKAMAAALEYARKLP